MAIPVTKENLTNVLEQYAGSQVPGLQYIVVDTNGVLFEYAGGWADIQNQKAMTFDTTLMGYSMTKTFTAVAIMQLVEEEKLELDAEIDRYLQEIPYRGRPITVRQLVDHTSGMPNPIPLRWAHLAEEDPSFDEDGALAQVLREYPDLAFEPGEKFAYSNIGYWLLGKIVETVTGQSYSDYLRGFVLGPLNISAQEMDLVIPDPSLHANGYLAKYSMMNLIKRFLMESKLWNGYEGNWLRLKSHYLNGPSFGGLIGTGRGFSYFLQDQLRTELALFNPHIKQLMVTQQTDNAGEPIPMSLGWHLDETDSTPYFYKGGGGGGFRSEMRLYPTDGIASVVMVNRTNFNSTQFLNRMDGAFLHP